MKFLAPKLTFKTPLPTHATPGTNFVLKVGSPGPKKGESYSMSNWECPSEFRAENRVFGRTNEMRPPEKK